MFGAAHEACLRATRIRRLGHRPDTATDLRPDVRELLADKGPIYSGSLVNITRTAFTDPTLNQGGTGSCGGHGESQQVSVATKSAGKPLGFQSSPGWWYRLARRISTPATSSGGPTLTDSGIDPEAILRAIAVGAVPIGTDYQCPTPDGRWSDVWGPDDGPAAPNVNDDVSLDAEEIGARGVVTFPFTAHNIDVSQTTMGLYATLSLVGVGVGLGIFVDSAFENWDPSTGPLDGDANLNDPNGGGHWVCNDECQIVGNSPGVWGIQNSWGTDWGQNGRILVTDRRLFSMLSQAIAIEVH